MTRQKRRKSKLEWRRVDLHLHTPASTDFQGADVTYLDILRVAAQKEIDVIAFTDHNSVVGYREMMDEMHQLELLEKLERLQQTEKEQLAEYRRLTERVLVLPGFEFTATFGFHILGIFSPDEDVRDLEFILRQLNVPKDKLDEASGEVGATVDVLTAYRVIDEAGNGLWRADAYRVHTRSPFARARSDRS
jgi:hypothetical protein